MFHSSVTMIPSARPAKPGLIANAGSRRAAQTRGGFEARSPQFGASFPKKSLMAALPFALLTAITGCMQKAPSPQNMTKAKADIEIPLEVKAAGILTRSLRPVQELLAQGKPCEAAAQAETELTRLMLGDLGEPERALAGGHLFAAAQQLNAVCFVDQMMKQTEKQLQKELLEEQAKKNPSI